MNTQIRFFISMLLLIVLSACATSDDVPREPTVVPFPTITPGVEVRGVLNAFRPDQSVANPATAVARASAPTATPDASACPPFTGEAQLRDAPDSSFALVAEMLRFLTAGGEPAVLEDTLRDRWGLLGEDGFARADIDFTGEGQPEVVLSYTTPSDGGMLLILGCEDRRYVERYRLMADTSAPPQIVHFGDMNRDSQNDLLFASRRCDATFGDTCALQTQLITWQPEERRFVSLLGTLIVADVAPEIVDIEPDEVMEIIIRADDNGTTTTGPLRTGTNIYDWDGSVYVLSIVRLDPPEWRIQIIHEADRQLAQGNTQTAITLYQQAFANENLRAWFDDESAVLDSYVLYRLLVAQAAAGVEDLLPVYQRIVETFPNPEQNTIYIEMSQVFWDAVQVTDDVSTACAEVIAYAERDQRGLQWLNRYGTRNPIYAVADLCPL